MKASLDTNVIIHFYKADLQEILFDMFDEGVCIYEQIRSVELENHGQEILVRVDADIATGRIEVYTYEKLKELSIHKVFDYYFKDNRNLYGSGDMGEVYAISLAQTLGVFSLVTDDTKQGGPYMSLLQLDYEIMPFNFADVLIIRYIIGAVDIKQTIADFNKINTASSMNWSFKSLLARFIRRFFTSPYRRDDPEWIETLDRNYNVSVKDRIKDLARGLETS